MTRGRFITLEGIEGAGKSSVARGLAAALAGAGRVVRLTREPGGTELAERIRRIVLERGAETVSPAAETLLMFAARGVHVDNFIRPSVERGEWVVCDRFTDATRAYQGGGRGMEAPWIDGLAAAIHPGLEPDLTLLLDLPVALGLERARARNAAGGIAQADRFESEAVPFFERVRARYLELAAAAPARFRVLDARAPQDAVLAAALAATAALG
jgi:dTMP kinase